MSKSSSSIVNAQNRQSGLDILKCICAFLVVCIHIPFNFPGGGYFLVVTRIAVPSFFMITGFFYDTSGLKKRAWQQIKRIAFLVALTGSIYFLWRILWLCITGKDISGFLKSTFTWELIVKYLLYNRALVGGHLWYLSALLYTLTVVAVFKKFKLFKLLYFAAPLLILADLVFGTYSKVLFGRLYWYFYFRNYLFVGIPYFVLGHFICDHKELLQNKFGGKKRCRTIAVLSVAAVFFCIISLFEYHFLNKAGLMGTRQNYIGTVFFVICVFMIFALFYKDCSSKAEKVLTYIGRALSGDIYIYHPIVINLCQLVFTALGVYHIYVLIGPAVVFLLTAATAHLLMSSRRLHIKN